MGRRRAAIQVTAAVGAAVVIGAIAGVPAAFADDPTQAWAELMAPKQINVPGSEPFAPSVSYSFADGGAEVPLPENAKFVIDATGLKGVATIKANHEQCTASGAIVTCKDNGNLHSPWEPFTLTVADGAKPGASGTISYEVTADKATGAKAQSTVVVGSPKLVVGKLPARSGLKIGSTVDLPVAVRNDGELATERTDVELNGSPGLSLVEKPRNCRADTDFGDTWKLHCTFQEAIEPGKAATLSTPVKVKVTEKALATWVNYSAEALPKVSDPYPGGAPGTDAPITLVPAEGGEFEAKAESSVTLDADNHADFAAQAGTITPAKRDRTWGYATFGMVNNGPAAAYRKDGKPLAYLDVTLPKGVTGLENNLDEEPDDNTNGECLTYVADGVTKPFEPGHRRYVCPEADTEEPGSGQTWELGVKIAKDADPKAKGTVKLLPGPAGFDRHDPTPANDTAEITFKGAPGSSTGGSSSGGSGDNGSTSGGDDSASGGSGSSGGDGSSGSTDGSSGSSGSAESSDSSDGGSLAITGAAGVGLLAGGAAAAVAVGAVAVVVTRRRKAAAGS